MDLQLRPSAGAAENLDLLRDPASGVMAAFVQGGAVPGQAADELVSLGAMFYEPMWLSVRGDQPLPSLHHLKGLRVAIGAPGSGSRVLAFALLRLKVIATSELDLVETSPDAAADRLESGDVDAAFMSLAWEAPVIRRLLLAPGI